jgi:hypothetical protein
MSGCGDTNPCAPVNPCDCAETADIREQGPPGARGLAGGIPIFQIGTVVSGSVPQVQLIQVNPLLYTMNFVVPSAGTNLPNSWTGIQTFTQQAVFQQGFSAVGATSTIFSLNVTNDFTSTGTSLFVGGAIFNGAVVFNGAVTADTIDTTGDATFNADVLIPNIPALAANVCYLGYVVVDNCGRLRFVNGYSPNSASNSNAISQTVTFNQAETQIAMTLPFTVPNVPACGVAMSANTTIFGRVVTGTGGALPADISAFVIRVRLDDPVVGTTLAGPSITNFESQGEWYVNANIAPGAHTLYFTISGNGVGSASILLIFIECSVQF